MTLAEFKKDYDWRAAFQEAIGGGYRWTEDGEETPIDGVRRVVAHFEGYNDGPEWLCVFEYRDDRIGVLRAGCDYTGWDCQASGSVEWFENEAEAISKTSLGREERLRLGYATPQEIREDERA